MIFALLTLLSALALASTAGWFSIVGFMAIYAGAPIPALIMGVVTEAAKLVTASWLYRNWGYADWKLKAPLVYFTIALMIATSIGVFGFLSKAHLEQGSGTIDNSAKIEQLNYQINREKSLIADNEKVIGQLDATVNSFLGKDRTDRSLSVRRSQAPQRKQLREESDAAQKRIDTLSSEKFTLESEVRKMQLEVGPIRYIAELFYGVEEDATKNIEAAVRIFTLLIVSTLDPLAVILLIAANHTLLRLRNEKEKKDKTGRENKEDGIRPPEADNHQQAESVVPGVESIVVQTIQEQNDAQEEGKVRLPIQEDVVEIQEINEKTSEENIMSDKGGIVEIQAPIIETAASEFGATGKEETVNVALQEIEPLQVTSKPTIIRQPALSRIIEADTSNQNETLFREIMGSSPHFIPKKVDEMIQPKVQDNSKEPKVAHKYPKALSWLTEFNRSQNG